jgi:hypothetical protein
MTNHSAEDKMRAVRIPPHNRRISLAMLQQILQDQEPVVMLRLVKYLAQQCDFGQMIVAGVKIVEMFPSIEHKIEVFDVLLAKAVSPITAKTLREYCHALGPVQTEWIIYKAHQRFPGTIVSYYELRDCFKSADGRLPLTVDVDLTTGEVKVVWPKGRTRRMTFGPGVAENPPKQIRLQQESSSATMRIPSIPSTPSSTSPMPSTPPVVSMAPKPIVKNDYEMALEMQRQEDALDRAAGFVPATEQARVDAFHERHPARHPAPTRQPAYAISTLPSSTNPRLGRNRWMYYSLRRIPDGAMNTADTDVAAATTTTTTAPRPIELSSSGWPTDDGIKEMLEPINKDHPSACPLCYMYLSNAHGDCGHLLCPPCVVKMRNQPCPYCHVSIQHFTRVYHPH